MEIRFESFLLHPVFVLVFLWFIWFLQLLFLATLPPSSGHGIGESGMVSGDGIGILVWTDQISYKTLDFLVTPEVVDAVKELSVEETKQGNIFSQIMKNHVGL